MQVFTGKRYDTACDVYSFGIVMWEVLTGRLPFTTVSGLFIDSAKCEKNQRLWYQEKVIEHDLRPHPLPGPPELDEITMRAWDKDPVRRPTATQLCNELTELAERYKVE
jgi:serine/threonine protein kinase